MSALIIGMGHAFPAHSLSQTQATRFALETLGLSGDAQRLTEIIHRRSGIERRGSVVLSATTPEAQSAAQHVYPEHTTAMPRPGTAERMRLYEELAPTLAREAAANALSDASIEARMITHVITASCTGFCAPGIDVHLITDLGLSPATQRIHIGYMGCHAAINALRAARAIAEADANACVLITCVELSTLHFQYSQRPDQIVANALFADGAAACVVASSGSSFETNDPEHATRVHSPLTILNTGSYLFPHSRAAMRWDVGDEGFCMTLAESVPQLIREHLPAWLGPWLRSTPSLASMQPADFAWAVHPGGPKVLDAVRDAMELPEAALATSRAVLREHGNMSSATSLMIVERLRAAGETRPIAMIAFGPGLCAEAGVVGRNALSAGFVRAR